MHIACDPPVDQRRHNGSTAQEHGFPGTGVFGSEPEGGGVLMVDAVHGAVQRTPVHGTMQPVVVGVLDEEPEEYLRDHRAETGEGSVEADTEELHHGVEEDDHGQLDDEMDQEDVLDAVPLVGSRRHLLVLDLVLEEQAGEGVDDGPGDAATEVDEFVGEEGDDAGGDDGIVPVGVVRPPELLQHIVLGELLVSQGVEVGIGGLVHAGGMGEGSVETSAVELHVAERPRRRQRRRR